MGFQGQCRQRLKEQVAKGALSGGGGGGEASGTQEGKQEVMPPTESTAGAGALLLGGPLGFRAAAVLPTVWWHLAAGQLTVVDARLPRCASSAAPCHSLPSTGEEAKGAPKFPQEGAKPDCDESWPNPCEPE